jgi:metal-responsive CopG/Arc/MetJ family transcriptional regulator
MVKKAVPKRLEPKPNADEGRTLIQVRVPAELLEAIDAEAARLSKAREGEPVSRSEAVRILVRRGLAASQK